MSTLCFSVTLLDGRFHGCADGGEREWPPSPWRLFQALLAGAHTAGNHTAWSDAQARAFLWLERRDPPLIVAPEPRELSPCQISVPNNDMDTLAAAWAKGIEPRKSAAELRTMKTLKPNGTAGNAPMVIHFLYPLADNERSADEVTTLCEVARCLHTFGLGIDAACALARVVSAEDAARLPGVRWRPQPEAPAQGPVRRVPTEGSLDDLARCHEEFTQRLQDGTALRQLKRPTVFRKAHSERNRRGTAALRQPKRPTVFRRVAYLCDADVPPRPFAAFDLMKLDDPEAWQPFRQEEANAVAAMLRSLACRLARGDTHQFPGGSEVYVAGHKESAQDPRPRFSYLVLPTIGHPHADGMIRRVLIAEPHGGDGAHAQWASMRLRGQTLTDHDGRPRAVLRAAAEHQSVTRLYTPLASSWSTVTPVILPGYDECKQPKAERLLLKAIEQAGLPLSAVSHITLRKAPFWPGSLHPCQYQRPNYLEHLPAWHVHLEFRKPDKGPIAIGAGRHVGEVVDGEGARGVKGPIAIGAGRHCGLGLFAAEAQDNP